MNLVSVKEVVPDRASEDSSAVDCSRQFVVEYDDPDATAPIKAMYESGIPARRSLYPVEISGVSRPRVVSKKSAQYEKASRRLWLVTVEYSNARERVAQVSPENDNDTAPWERDPKYSYDFESREVALEADYSDTPKPIVNVVGDKFDPPVAVEAATPRVIITRASQSYNPSNAALLINTVNAGSITIDGTSIPAGRARLLKWSAEKNEWADGGGTSHEYYDETIEIALATDETNGFDIQVANTGYRYLVDGNPVRVPNATTPVFLSEDGTAYQSGSSITPNYIVFRPYKWQSWAAINL